MKFAHIADCHLGGWRNPELQRLNLNVFEKAIEACISEKVNFVLITGDLFDNAMPSIDILKVATEKLRKLKEKNIPCYIIAGSHDYSASGKTFLDVLEKAGLCENIERIDKDEMQVLEKENVILAGISGKKCELEKELIKKVKVKIKGDKLKILALHTTINENKINEFMSGIDVEELPKGFDYYALGHIHKPFNMKIDGKLIIYPGPLFPNNFSELEELGNGGFFIVNEKNKNIEIERYEIKEKNIFQINVNADCKAPEIITSEIVQKLKHEKIKDNIVMIKITGTLAMGKTSDINFLEIEKEAKKGGCYTLLKNLSGLENPEFKIKSELKSENVEDIEKEIISKQKGEFSKFSNLLIKSMIIEKLEGEKSEAFESRLMEEFSKIIGIKI
ncbi:MAG: DNA repair exonuclease [Candidatus Pacearchaeota archaeon]